MTDFLVMISIQTVFMGIALFLYAQSVYRFFLSKTLLELVANAAMCAIFLSVLILLGTYWWVTLTRNANSPESESPKTESENPSMHSMHKRDVAVTYQSDFS